MEHEHQIISKKSILFTVLIVLSIVLVTLAIEEYKDLRDELTHIRTEFRKQEFAISDLNAQIELLHKIGVEVSVVDVSSVVDLTGVDLDEIKTKDFYNDVSDLWDTVEKATETNSKDPEDPELE